MIMRIFLIWALLGLTLYAFTQRTRSRLISYVMAIAALIGMTLVAFPEAATDVAHFVGVGRGADLIAYLFMVIAIAAIFNLHLRNRMLDQRLSELAKSFALHTAKSPHENRKECRSG